MQISNLAPTQGTSTQSHQQQQQQVPMTHPQQAQQNNVQTAHNPSAVVQSHGQARPPMQISNLAPSQGTLTQSPQQQQQVPVSHPQQSVVPYTAQHLPASSPQGNNPHTSSPLGSLLTTLGHGLSNVIHPQPSGNPANPSGGGSSIWNTLEHEALRFAEQEAVNLIKHEASSLVGHEATALWHQFEHSLSSQSQPQSQSQSQSSGHTAPTGQSYGGNQNQLQSQLQLQSQPQSQSQSQGNGTGGSSSIWSTLEHQALSFAEHQALNFAKHEASSEATNLWHQVENSFSSQPQSQSQSQNQSSGNTAPTGQSYNGDQNQLAVSSPDYNQFNADPSGQNGANDGSGDYNDNSSGMYLQSTNPADTSGGMFGYDGTTFIDPGTGDFSQNTDAAFNSGGMFGFTDSSTYVDPSTGDFIQNTDSTFVDGGFTDSIDSTTVFDNGGDFLFSSTTDDTSFY
ncbi:hypothetical protein BDP27DRAFT_1426885 [Rhodocollybia butyracea]|uniref:Uncharacterized protein n=1 Tax=Rhodocollybia butyracea TaxID=206335 RepID=A0A9P5PIX3_9AGAR|nr:hypothetical protein BDP27DRAFT_1426885 [Rhodocollybia butyracea]